MVKKVDDAAVDQNSTSEIDPQKKYLMEAKNYLFLAHS